MKLIKLYKYEVLLKSSCPEPLSKIGPNLQIELKRNPFLVKTEKFSPLFCANAYTSA